MTLLQDLRNRAAQRPAHIVLSEGHDQRVVKGALDAARAGIARGTLVGPQQEVEALLAEAGGCPATDQAGPAGHENLVS